MSPPPPITGSVAPGADTPLPDTLKIAISLATIRMPAEFHLPEHCLRKMFFEIANHALEDLVNDTKPEHAGSVCNTALNLQRNLGHWRKQVDAIKARFARKQRSLVYPTRELTVFDDLNLAIANSLDSLRVLVANESVDDPLSRKEMSAFMKLVDSGLRHVCGEFRPEQLAVTGQPEVCTTTTGH
jgi:hypothetical protein